MNPFIGKPGSHPAHLSSSSYRWIIVLILCMTPSLVVALSGLDRAYDAIPDQDMLWASEALRLHSGRGPSYADHPGVYWSLSYLAKLNYFQSIGETVLNTQGLITTQGISRLIRASRLENGLICGFTGYLVYPICRILGKSSVLASIAALTTAGSAALLVGVSEIRNEITSTLFLLAYVILAVSAAGMIQKQKSIAISLSIVAVATFLLAALCKQQVLMASPLAFIAAVTGIALTDNQQTLQKVSILWQYILKTLKHTVITIVALAAPWLLAAAPDIDLINLPFWLGINAGLSLIFWLGTQPNPTPSAFKFAVIGVGTIEVLILKIFTFNWWRQGVTGFPSWMFSHAKPQTSNTIIAEFLEYFQDLFHFHILAAAFFLTLLIFTAKNGLTQRNPALIIASTSLALTAALIIANTQRYAQRYEIYFFLPLLVIATVLAEPLQSKGSTTSNPTSKAIIILSATLIALAATTSIANMTRLENFVHQSQPPSFRCYGQHMDRLMQLTSAGQCPNFAEAARGKNQFD